MFVHALPYVLVFSSVTYLEVHGTGKEHSWTDLNLLYQMTDVFQKLQVPFNVISSTKNSTSLVSAQNQQQT